MRIINRFFALIFGCLLLSACVTRETVIIIVTPEDLKSANIAKIRNGVMPGKQKEIVVRQSPLSNTELIQIGNTIVTIPRDKPQTIAVKSPSEKSKFIKSSQNKKNIHPIINQPIISQQKQITKKSTKEKLTPIKTTEKKPISISEQIYHFSFINRLFQTNYHARQNARQSLASKGIEATAGASELVVHNSHVTEEQQIKSSALTGDETQASSHIGQNLASKGVETAIETSKLAVKNSSEIKEQKIDASLQTQEEIKPSPDTTQSLVSRKMDALGEAPKLEIQKSNEIKAQKVKPSALTQKPSSPTSPPTEKPEQSQSADQTTPQPTSQTPSLAPQAPVRFSEVATAMLSPQPVLKTEKINLRDQLIKNSDQETINPINEPVLIKPLKMPSIPTNTNNAKPTIKTLPNTVAAAPAAVSFARNNKIILNNATPFKVSISTDLARIAEQKKLDQANKNWRVNTIVIHQPILIAWRQVGVGLTTAGYTVMYRDPYLTSYYVADRTRTRGLYQRDTPVFRVRLYSLGDTTLVTMYDAKGNYVVENDLKRLYRVLP